MNKKDDDKFIVLDEQRDELLDKISEIFGIGRQETAKPTFVVLPHDAKVEYVDSNFIVTDISLVRKSVYLEDNFRKDVEGEFKSKEDEYLNCSDFETLEHNDSFSVSFWKKAVTISKEDFEAQQQSFEALDSQRKVCTLGSWPGLSWADPSYWGVPEEEESEPVPDTIKPEYGATCESCGQFNEYAEKVSSFKCWSCRNGF